ncbi:MAG: hypothetical protein ACOYKM_02365 [Caulobacterales bacterium]
MNRRQILASAIGISATSWAGDARAENGRWLTAETDLFRVYSEGEPDRMREMVTALDQFDKLLRVMTATPTAPSRHKLSLYLSAWAPTMAEARGEPLRHVAGFYDVGLDEVAAFAFNQDRDNIMISPMEILRHEYTHHFMLHHHAGSYPSWYVEGFAELMQTATMRDGVYEVGRGSIVRIGWLTSGDQLPLEQLLIRQRRAGEDRDEVAHFYAQAWLLTHYIQFNPQRQQAFARYIAALRAGQDPIEAFAPSFGVTIAETETDLAAYARGRIPIAIVRLPSMQAPTLTPQLMPASADQLLMLASRVRRSLDDDEAPVVLAAVRERARGFPNDIFALETLAHTEAQLGTRAAAERAIEHLLYLDPNNANAHLARGISQLRASQTLLGPQRDEACAAARASFGRANRLRPDHPGTLYRFAMTYVAAGQPMPEAAIEVLLEAQALAPQVHEITLASAFALFQIHEFAQATALAETVAFNPHAGSHRTTAAALLRQIEQRTPAADEMQSLRSPA